MALSLTSHKLTIQLSATYTNTLTDGSSTNVKHPNLNYNPKLTSGISANQANRGWQSKDRTLSSGANETLDIFDFAAVDIGGGVGLDGLGQAVTFEEIVAIVIVNENAVTAAGKLEVEPDAANGWTVLGIQTVATGGAIGGQGQLCRSEVAEDGLGVTDASNHRLKFTANGGDVTYSIYILARHDDDESSSSSSSSSASSSSSSSISSASSKSSPSSQSSSSSSVSSSSSSASSSSWSSKSSRSVSSISTSSVSSSSSSISSVSSTSSSSSSSASSSSWSSQS